MTFPAAFIAPMRVAVGAVDGVTECIGRPLRGSDPDGCASVYAGDWVPVDYETGHEFGEPSMGRYEVNVQVMSKGTPEEAVYELHSVLAKKVRTVLYRDRDLRVALAALTEVDSNEVERFGRLIVERQRYFSNEVSGAFLYLAHTLVCVETNI